jgi:hypothetical protein
MMYNFARCRERQRQREKEKQMKTIKNQKGVTGLEILITIIVLIVVGIIIIIANTGKDTTPSSQAPGTVNTCFTYCMGVLEFQCGDNEFIGLCAGLWDCRDELGVHECK